VRPSDRIDALVTVAEQTLRQAGLGLVRGDADVSPLVEDRCRACEWCEFQTVCRFDPAYNRTRSAENDLPQTTSAARTGDGQ
jgi:ATP-dependent helicase/DNAse subunit B